MKKIYGLLFIVSLTIGNTQAQTSKPHWGFGLLGGINRSIPFLAGSSDSPFQSRISPVFAVDVSYNLNQWSSFRVQPSWANLSYQPDKTAYSGWVYQNLRVATIKLPLLYRYTFHGYQFAPSGNHLTPFLEVGMAYNRAIRSEYASSLSIPCDFCGPPYSGHVYTTTYSLVGKSAVSLVGSMGVSINRKRISIPVLLRYERYLTGQTFSADYSSSTIDNTSSTIRFENISLMTGINF